MPCCGICGAEMGDGSINLTPAEKTTAQLVREGLSNIEIGNRMGILETTVKAHIKFLFLKLKVKNRIQLAIAVNAGLPLDSPVREWAFEK